MVIKEDILVFLKICTEKYLSARGNMSATLKWYKKKNSTRHHCQNSKLKEKIRVWQYGLKTSLNKPEDERKQNCKAMKSLGSLAGSTQVLANYF